MNTGSALAAMVSPLVAGSVIDAIGNWYLPFLMSMGFAAAFLMQPETPFEEGEVVPVTSRPVAAE